MENEICTSVPCLLDELMDSEVIKCDVGLGMTIDPVFASKASPSHESDSGCSDMSEVRSVSPLSEVDFLDGGDENQVKLFDFDSVAGIDDATEEFDSELATYLAVPLPHDKTNSGENETSLKTPEPLNRSIAFPEVSSPKISVDSDSDDQDYVPSGERRVIQAKALKVTGEVKKTNVQVINLPLLKNAKTDIHVLPSSSRSSGVETRSSKTSTPAVKVVKVVKTAAQSKQEIDQELMQALDDRNKKNAIQAKLNREKKKAYIKSLEDEIEELKCENFTLKESNRKSVNEKNELLEEIEYLRNVIANQSALSGLLKNIGNVENVRLTSSFNRKRSADLDHDYPNVAKRTKLSRKKPAGICLHVDQGNVSLEFCSKCATMAKSGSDEGN